ncbi:MAG: DegT/DnrJ/EryC1/StrS family aminotransferase [Phycisphaeraceae bacterium]|nr:DegT/DnrJ/EryC1/StrS family aminotransferase [Phycisphaerales bacterium]MCB9860706.1 DegT/DnrJ/EryC1/StrS family aminotransferase [Phycisphaeraceae bacterium]
MSINEIPLSRPDITKREIDLVTRTMMTGRLSIGPMQERFEQQIAEQSGRNFGVAVSSGTAGLHLVLRALEIGPGDEVVTTPFSFVASSNAILYVGATPVFVDVEPNSLNMDPEKVEAAITPRTRAILAVETFGNAAHMDKYAAIAARHEIPLIEDCCEALGSSCRGRPAGSFGRAGVFAFYPNKQITTGEGGVIVTDDERLAEVCRSMRSHGRPCEFDSAHAPTPERSVRDPVSSGPSPSTGSWLTHVRLGFNYRMSEIQAAIGVGQMERFQEILQKRESVAGMYMSRLMGVPELTLPDVMPGTEVSWFVFVVRLQTEYSCDDRDRIITELREHDVGAAPYFPCIHLLPFYREMFGFEPGMFPIAESVSQRTIALPFHSQLTERDVDIVCQTLELMISRQRLARS